MGQQTLCIPIHRIAAEGTLHVRAKLVLGDVGEGIEAGGGTADLDLHLDQVGRSVRVHGSVDITWLGPCDRCLAPVTQRVVLAADHLFVPESEIALEGDEQLGEVWGYGEEGLDLAAFSREVALLDRPYQRLCGPDCKGLCPRCGADRNEGPCTCTRRAPVGGLAALRTLFDQH